MEYEDFRMQSKGAHPYPWRTLDPTAERKVEMTVRCNQWEYEVLRYVCSLEHTSLSKYLLKHGVAAALHRVLQQEETPIE